MSGGAWDGGSNISNDLDANSGSGSLLSRQTSIGISRSQDDATVGYYFQRPQSENDLQAYGGGKRWAIGDDTLVEQAKSVSDLEREFQNLGFTNDFSAKKFWEIDDSGHVSDGKGSMFSASSPWSPRHSTWSSPTTDNNVTQALQLSPGRHRPFDGAVGLGAADMVEYVLGDPLAKNLPSGLRNRKHDFSHDPSDQDVIKTPKKASKTSSPFEAVDSNNGIDNTSTGDRIQQLCNGNTHDDGFRVRSSAESTLAKLGRDVEEQSPIHHTPQKSLNRPSPASNSVSNASSVAHSAVAAHTFSPILQSSSAMEHISATQAYGLGDMSSGTLDPLTFSEYQLMGSTIPAMDSPAANQYTSMVAPLDYPPPTHNMAHHSNHPSLVTSINNGNHPQQQQLPQQPPTPGGQSAAGSNHNLPFIFGQSQQPSATFNTSQPPPSSQPPPLPPQQIIQAPPHQHQQPGMVTAPPQQSLMSHQGQSQFPPSNQQQQQLVSGTIPGVHIPLHNHMSGNGGTQHPSPAPTMLPPPNHPSASTMLIGTASQDQLSAPAAPNATVGMALGPVQYIQTPYGIYPANLLQSQQAAMAPPPPQLAPQASSTPQILNHQQRQPASLTPGQQQQQQHQQQSDVQQQQQQPQVGTQQMPPNFIDINNGYPTILAFYDQNGQLVPMNSSRGMANAPIRLYSPAQYVFNPNAGPAAASNVQQQQQPQGFNSTGSVNYNGGGAGTVSVAGTMQPANALHINSSGGATVNTAMQPLGHMSMSSSSSTAVGTAAPTPQSYSQNFTVSNAAPDFSLVMQRQDSFGSADPNDKYRGGIYPNVNLPATPSGPLGLVQPPPCVTPPPSLGAGLGLSLGSGGKLYSTAPGAEGTYRNAVMPHAGQANMVNNQNASVMYQNRPKDAAALNMGRSRLLEEFRSNRMPNLQLKDLNNHVVEFSQDQHGSRFIQQKLERASVLEKQLVFNEILSAAYSLMTDVFGNYVIQKFFEFGLPEQKQSLAQKLSGQVLPLALQMYGCRVIQKALESISCDMQIVIVKELDGHILQCVKDQNGNHVVQKCIECVDPKHLQFIIDAFRGQVFTLSTHPYGCRVIQRILEHCLAEQTMAILSELHDQTERLVLDQYGNYVIQHVLEHGQLEEKSKIVNHIRGNVLNLSQHKFASNVVEKCVANSSRAEKAVLIEEVCSASDGGQSALYIMMKDQYANYVIQKMLDIAEPNQRKILMHKIRPHIGTLRKYTYGKHIIAKLEKYLIKNGGGDLATSPLTLTM